MTNTDGLYNAIYILLGTAYDWNTYQLANIFGVTYVQFEMWLQQMGFSQKEIQNIRERKPFEPGYCKYCGAVCEKELCSEECTTAILNRKLKLYKYITELRVPTTTYKNTYFNITLGEVQYEYRKS